MKTFYLSQRWSLPSVERRRLIRWFIRIFQCCSSWEYTRIGSRLIVEEMWSTISIVNWSISLSICMFGMSVQLSIESGTHSCFLTFTLLVIVLLLLLLLSFHTTMLNETRMKLESLSNELFIDLFEYFNAVDLLRAFGELNRRFNSLLFDYCRTYRADFRSISNEDFDDFFRRHFPLIKSRIVYLRLSDDDDTPYQCSRFLSADVRLAQFENLRSLTFNHLGFDPKINQEFFVDLHRLRHLTHLKFVECSFFHRYEMDFQGMTDQIWNLPQLTHLYWDGRFHKTTSFCLPACVSTSLQCLTIFRHNCSSNNFAPLFAKTPRLRKFCVSLDTYEEDDLPVKETFVRSSPHLSVRKLLLSQVSSRRLLTNLLHFLPNVNHLKIETTSSIKFDGHQWKQLVLKSLPRLKVFQLKTNLNFPWNENHRETFERYFATYRTSFWIERRWFIRFHWGFWAKYLSIYLYSLPYAFNDYPIPSNMLNFQIRSTCPDDLSLFSYDSIRHIGYEPSMFKDQVMSQIQLMNVEKLFVELPFDSRFLSLVPTFCNLRSLVIDVPSTDSEFQLQLVLDVSPRLEILLFRSWTTTAMPPYRLSSPSIDRLDVEGEDPHRREYRYNGEQCLQLIRSPLGRQCRVLTIRVEDIECIVLLASMMTKLRTLHVQCENDHRQNKDDLVKVLEEWLSSKWNVTRLCYGSITIRSAWLSLFLTIEKVNWLDQIGRRDADFFSLLESKQNWTIMSHNI